MAKDIDTKLDKPVIAILKKGLKVGEKVEAMVKAGVPRGQVSLYLYRLEHVADPTLDLTNGGKIKGKSLEKVIVKARLEDKLRWERIAYRAGLVDSEGSLGSGVGKVKDILKEAGHDPDEYVGRGRRFDGTTGETKPASTKRGRGGGNSGGGTSGRRQAAQAKDTEPKPAGRGRRGAAAKPAETAAAKPAGRGRRGTRATAGKSDPK